MEMIISQLCSNAQVPTKIKITMIIVSLKKIKPNLFAVSLVNFFQQNKVTINGKFEYNNAEYFTSTIYICASSPHYEVDRFAKFFVVARRRHLKFRFCISVYNAARFSCILCILSGYANRNFPLACSHKL